MISRDPETGEGGDMARSTKHGTKHGRILTAALAVLALGAAGCAGIEPEAREMLWHPPSCENATAKIETLEANRAGGFKRFTQGVQGLAPPMVVLSTLRDIFWGKPFRSIYLDHWRIAFGGYNREINHRVHDLKKCS
jgi:hypothetical protein